MNAGNIQTIFKYSEHWLRKNLLARWLRLSNNVGVIKNETLSVTGQKACTASSRQLKMN